MDTQRKSQSPLMGTSQRMGLARSIFDVPPEMETNRRLTRSIRNTSNEPIMTDYKRDPNQTGDWRNVDSSNRATAHENDQFVFRTVQTYKPQEVQQSFQYKKPDYAESRASRQQQSTSQIKQSIRGYTPQDYNKPISYDVHQTSYKPSETYRSSEMRQPDALKYDQSRTIDPISYKPHEPSNIYKSERITDYGKTSYRPTNEIIVNRPSANVNETLNRMPSYKPENSAYVQQSYKQEPYQSYKQDQYQSYKQEPLSSTYKQEPYPSYKPEQIVTTANKELPISSTYKAEPSNSHKPDYRGTSNSKYDPMSSVLQKTSDEFIVVESPNTEHEYQAQCQIF